MCFKLCSAELLLKLKMHHCDCALISRVVHVFGQVFKGAEDVWISAGGIRVHIFNNVSWKKAQKIRNSENLNF